MYFYSTFYGPAKRFFCGGALRMRRRRLLAVLAAAVALLSVRARDSDVAIVMVDTRRPSIDADACATLQHKEVDADQLELVTFTYFLNLEYARAHGYDLLYYQLKGENCTDGRCAYGCSHSRWGPRHPSYCKVAGLGAALSLGYRWVVYTDSDAFIADTSLSLPRLLNRYGARDFDGVDGFFGWDVPYTLGPNMGFIVLRNSHLSKVLVREWWNIDPGLSSNYHPYEQQPMQWQLMHTRRFRSRLRTLRLTTMAAAKQVEAQAFDLGGKTAVMHLDHTLGTRTRLWELAAAVSSLLCSNSVRDAPSAGCTEGLRLATETFSQGSNGVALKHRDALLRVALLGACERLRLTGQTIPPIIPFDATQSARELLRDEQGGSSAGLHGMPLHLSTCAAAGTAPARWQSWVVVEGSTTTPGELRHELKLVAKPTLCLALGKARSPKSPYQTLAQLASCRLPLPSSRNGGSVSAAGHRARIMFDAGGSGLIHSLDRLGTLRTTLPEMATDCGFWSNCSRIATVLPKQCWLELWKNASACGDSEMQIKQALERSKHGNAEGKDRFVLGNQGPCLVAQASLARRTPFFPFVDLPRVTIPESQEARIFPIGHLRSCLQSDAQLNDDAESKLCLRPWRGGRLGTGSPLVFDTCAERAGRRLGGPSEHMDPFGAFEWEAREAKAGGKTVHKIGDRRGPVHISPRKAPHLCLSAPSVLTSDALDDGAWAATIEQVAASDKKAARWADWKQWRQGLEQRVEQGAAR